MKKNTPIQTKPFSLREYTSIFGALKNINPNMQVQSNGLRGTISSINFTNIVNGVMCPLKKGDIDIIKKYVAVKGITNLVFETVSQGRYCITRKAEQEYRMFN